MTMTEPGRQDTGSLRKVVEAALRVAKKRAALLDEVAAALEGGDDQAAIALMRKYCNLPPKKEKRPRKRKPKLPTPDTGT
jgi:hypothetical protein